jgi:hypothetical protein
MKHQPSALKPGAEVDIDNEWHMFYKQSESSSVTKITYYQN